MAYKMEAAAIKFGGLRVARLPSALYRGRWQLLVGQVLIASLLLWSAGADVALAAPSAPFEIESFAVPHDGQPFAITPGPDGDLWFAQESNEYSGHPAIGRVTTAGEFSEFGNAEPSFSPQAIVSGPDGNLWFTEKTGIGRLTPSGAVSTFAVPSNLRPSGITASPDGNLWSAAAESSEIGRITTEGQVTVFPGPDKGCLPRELAHGSDGGVWFTESACEEGPHIGRVNSAGEVTQFPVDFQARGIAQGPDDLMWFTGKAVALARSPRTAA
jgi:streptogramin lyase